MPAYLAAKPTENEWLVSRYFDGIQPGDRVFVWGSGSEKAQPAGVVADATVLTRVREIADDGPAEFWFSEDDRFAVRPRVRIALGRVANKKEVIKRDWWKEDPILRDHLIMRMANHTTFRIDGDALVRLEQLWERTGSDWPYEDSVAGLHAFLRTRGAPVSRLPGSPVADTALLIGRPIAGVYNKVMNFRSLDPEDDRSGLDGASDQDRRVWGQFYGAQGLRAAEIQSELERLWVLPDLLVDATAARRKHEEQAEQLTRTLTLDQLLQKFRTSRTKTGDKPTVRNGTTKVFARDPLVSAIARRRAQFACEAPDCTIALFRDPDGVPYVEVHHIHTLATGGSDTPENVACLCPLHHREAHHGANASELIAALRAIRLSDKT